MAHPDHALWKKSWRDHQTSFHLSHVHPLLAQYWPQMGIAEAECVFVPLCGKSLDLMWLKKQGHGVVGVELSPIAVRSLFRSAKLDPVRHDHGALIRWGESPFSVFCGDFFALTRSDLLGVSVVYDRAALTALPENLRDQYVRHLHEILPNGCQILLLTVEDLDDDESVTENMSLSEEIASLYAAHFSIALLHAEYHDRCLGLAGEIVESRCIHKAYHLRHLS